jgi:hypothetical protein
VTPKKAFDSGGFNPNNGLFVKDWYGVGCVFVPQRVRHENEILFGFRMLACTDMASHFDMHRISISKAPAPVMSAEIRLLLEETIERHGKPHHGIAISHSVWQSSLEMFLDEDTEPQGRFLKENEIEFGPMRDDEQQKIRQWIEGIGVRCEFNADNISTPN